MGSSEQEAAPAPSRIVLSGCEVDVAQCELVRDGERQHLTTKEVEVLAYLAQNPSRAVSYEELLERVWGHPRLASTQPVYSVIKRLRRKLDGLGEHRHLVTVHGVGYRFEPPPRVAAPPADLRTPRPSPSAAMRLSSFVGRRRELALLEAALASGARIVSLVGPGGAGKTRLALELLARTAAQGSEVVLADLSDVAPGRDVTDVIAVAVGARESVDDDRRSYDATLRALRARRVWAVLLDSAEHVLDSVAGAAAELATVTSVLVTSRERLGVPGEHVIEVGPLSEADGVQLFSERARAAGAPLSDPALASPIVSRLDGLPLAIELAAAHAGVVSLEHAARDLEHSIDRLRATRRGVPLRHATLRSSVEWSWGLVSAEERVVLSQCVVFSGGFTAEAAEAVVSGVGSVGAHLCRLSERSLLRALGSPGQGGRFALYQSVRELAAEHLEGAAEVEERHARWALGRAKSAGALDEVPPASAYADLAPDAENLRAAFQRSIGRDVARAGELALALDFLEAGTRGPGAAAELSVALAVATGALAVRLRLALGRSRQHAGAEGVRFLEETCVLARAHGASIDVLEAERLWAASLAALGAPGAALGPLEAALARARELAPESPVLGRIALDLAETHLAAGRVERAKELATEAGRVLEAAGAPSQAARAACALSHVHREEGEPESSLAALERARRLLEDAGDEVALARLALDRGVLLAHLSRSDEAVLALEASIAAHHRLGLVTGEIRARDWMVLALLGLGRDEEALAQAREMQLLAHTLGRPSYEAERAFAATWLVLGRLTEADAAFGRALELLSAGGKATVRGHVLSARALGRVLSARLADAEADLVECVAIHAQRGSEAALLHSRAELALVRELDSARDDTDAILKGAERASGAPWERRHAAGRRAVVEIVRARRAGRPEDEIAQRADAARAALTGATGRPSDYFTRVTLLLVEHVASPRTLRSGA